MMGWTHKYPLPQTASWGRPHLATALPSTVSTLQFLGRESPSSRLKGASSNHVGLPSYTSAYWSRGFCCTLGSIRTTGRQHVRLSLFHRSFQPYKSFSVHVQLWRRGGYHRRTTLHKIGPHPMLSRGFTMEVVGDSSG